MAQPKKTKQGLKVCLRQRPLQARDPLAAAKGAGNGWPKRRVVAELTFLSAPVPISQPLCLLSAGSITKGV